jgi:NADH-quinone oxidoreductase subunit G/NADP-reducing hydrogenase subunit HndD
MLCQGRQKDCGAFAGIAGHRAWRNDGGREIHVRDRALHVAPIVGFDRVKEASVTIEDPLEAYRFLNGVTVRVAVTSGFKGAKILMDQLAKGESPYHFIEVMGCPGGCIMGGGQPRSDDPDVREKRLRGLYDEDESKTLRKSHDNPFISSIYKEYLEHPNSHVSHELLHTHYVQRGQFNEFTDERFDVGIKQPKAGRRPVGADKRAQAFAADLPETRPVREAPESVRVQDMESENARLKKDLADALETVGIFKDVVADYARKQLK